LFCLSLGSKELFHSDFLYWLGGTYRGELGPIFSRFLEDQSGDCSLAEWPQREKQNIDLQFKFRNGAELVVENKVKSIPSEEQLARYTEEQLREGDSGKKNFLLISVTRPPFVTGHVFCVGGRAWHYLDYAGLSNLLGPLADKIEDAYHSALLNDYIRFAAALHGISKNADIDFERDTWVFNDGEVLQKLKNIRMHDYYLKKKFYLIAEELHQRLARVQGEAFSGKVKRGGWNVEGRQANASVNTILAKHDMTRGQGLVDMMYVVKEGLCLGVQVQANSYRHLVAGSPHSESVARELKSRGLWFNFPRDLGPDLTEYPNRRGRDFNHFGEEFYFRSVTIPTERKISEVIDCMVKDARTIAALGEQGRAAWATG
jgi:hypothetical protein